MKFIGFTYDERRKSYFSDKHEDQENRIYRKQFISKYFELEKRTHHWVQIDEDSAKEMEKNQENPLMKNVYFEFKKIIKSTENIM